MCFKFHVVIKVMTGARHLKNADINNTVKWKTVVFVIVHVVENEVMSRITVQHTGNASSECLVDV